MGRGLGKRRGERRRGSFVCFFGKKGGRIGEEVPTQKRHLKREQSVLHLEKFVGVTKSRLERKKKGERG